MARGPGRRALLASAGAVVVSGLAGLPGLAAPGVPGSVTDLVVMRDLSYGASPARRLDVYRSRRTSPAAPAVVFVHGGGWSTGDKSWVAGGTPMRLEAWRDALVLAGYAVVAVDHRLTGEARYPALVDDVRAAVAFVRRRAARLGIDPGRIALAGESSGAHLALLAAYTPTAASAVGAVVSYYGFTDLARLYADRAAAGCAPVGSPGHTAEEGLLGVAPSGRAGRALAGEASPLTHVRAGAPPTLLFQGASDCLVPPAQADRLAAALARAGVPVARASTGGGHGDPAFYTRSDLQRTAVDFLDAHLGSA